MRVPSRWLSSPVHRRPLTSCSVEVAGGVIRSRFCASPEFDIARGGSRVTILLPTSNGSGSYRLVSIDGATSDTVVNRTYRFKPKPIPRSIPDAIRSSNADDPVLPSALRDAYRTANYPSIYPTFSGFLLGVDKTMWLREYGDEGSPHRWQVLDQCGEPLGTVEMPEGGSLPEASLTTLWGIELNEGDVQSDSPQRTPRMSCGGSSVSQGSKASSIFALVP